MGLLPAAPVQLAFDDVRVPLQYRIGDEGEGGHIHERFGFASNSHRILSGLIPLSTAQSALDMALSYSKKREAFGRPIAQFQAISGKIAEGFAKIEMGKSLCRKGLWLIDQGLPGTKEAAMCSWLAPKFAYQIIEDAILIHGHAGYSDDHPFQQMLRDVIAFELIGGTEEMMKLIIARNVIGKPAIPPEVWNQMI
jgi:cyclohexanecarboxyl-CoA dehydrogenase